MKRERIEDAIAVAVAVHAEACKVGSVMSGVHSLKAPQSNESPFKFSIECI